MKLLTLTLLAIVAPATIDATAATKTWNGSTAGSWQIASNWIPSGTPATGDALVFPPSAAKLSTTNSSVAPTSFHSISISGSNYVLVGPGVIVITNGLTNAPIAATVTNTVRAHLVPAASQAWVTGGKSVLVLSSNLTITNVTLTLMNAGLVQAEGSINGGSGSTLNKTNNGKLEINGVASLTQLNVQDGELQVDGRYSGGLSISNGATLSGSGTVSGFTCAGMVAPGNASAPGILTASGGGAFSPGSTMRFNLNSPVAGTGHDQLKVPAPPSLTGCTLGLFLGYTPSVGDTFVLITNTGVGTFTTRFTGLPQAATQTVNNVKFRISYSGGNGNDLTATVVDGPLVVTGQMRTWTGAGATGFFSNPANWAGGLAPQDGDSVLFPAGLPASDSVATNDLFIRYNQVLCASNGGNMTIFGERMELAGGIIATQSSGALILQNDVTFRNDATIQIALGNVSLAGLIDIGGSDLTTTGGSGRLLVSGSLTGSGGLVVNHSGGAELNNGNLHQGATRLLGGPVTVARIDSLGGSNTAPTFVGEGMTLTINAPRLLESSVSLTGRMTFTALSTSNVSSAIEFTGPNAIVQAAALVTAQFSGPWTGAGAATLDRGEFVLNSTHAVAGGILVTNGARLSVNGSGTSDITLIPTQFECILSGTGSVGRVLTPVSGLSLIKPGDGRGDGPGILTTSNLLLNGSAQCFINLNGTTPGATHDQLRVRGTVSLGNCRLNLVPGYTPAPGETFVLIDNDGTDAVIGRFASLAEGAILTIGSASLRLSYSGGDGNDVVLVTQGAPAPFNLRTFDSPAGRRVAIAWSAPASGPAVSEYVVYRNGFEFKRGEPSAFGPQLIAEDQHILPGHTYTYTVVAIFADGTVSPPSNEFTIVAPILPPVTGTNQIVTVLLRFPEFPEEPLSTNQVNAMMFTASNSVKRYMEEVSYGRFTIEGSTHGWFTLPRPAASYCGSNFPNGLWYFCDIPMADIYSALPPAVSNLVETADRVQFAIHGLGTVGEAGGRLAFYSATNGFTPGVIIHELGHTFGFLHASSLISCTGYPLGPDLVRMRTNNCFTLLYGDLYDPMGSASTFHYNTYFKESAGWLPTNNIAWITNDGDYTLHAVERPTNAIQMLKIDLGGEMFWFLEYRTPTGMDSTNSPLLNSSPIDGVLMHVRVSRLILSSWDTFWIQPVARTSTPWFDPYSGLAVTVLSQSNGVARIRVSGMSHAFHMIEAQRTGPDGRNLALTWNAVPGARYLIQGSTDLFNWTTLESSVDASNRVHTQILPNAGTNAHRFFRAAVDTGP